MPIAADDEGEHKGMPKFFFFAADWKEGAPVFLMCRNLPTLRFRRLAPHFDRRCSPTCTVYVAAHLCV